MSGKKPRDIHHQEAVAPKVQVKKPMGLARILQKAGYGTRDTAAGIIRQGRIMVDDAVVKDPSFMVTPGSDLKLDQKILVQADRIYFAFHKPARVVCAAVDGPDRRRVADFLPPDVPGLNTVGRMDNKTTGLLLVSNDSTWNNTLAESKNLEQEYRIQVEGELSDLEISVITAGINMPNLGLFRPASVKIVEKLNNRTVILMVIKGSKARMIRRMFSTLRHKITLLRRIRIGEIRLGTMPPGGLRQLEKHEVAETRNQAATEKRPKLKPRPRNQGR